MGVWGVGGGEEWAGGGGGWLFEWLMYCWYLRAAHNGGTNGYLYR